MISPGRKTRFARDAVMGRKRFVEQWSSLIKTVAAKRLRKRKNE
jgi:hypothetical protein